MQNHDIQDKQARFISERYDVSPCLVITAGTEAVKRFKYIHDTISFWLGDSFPDEAVGWACIDTEDQVSNEWSEQLVKQMFNETIWDKMYNEGYVQRTPEGTMSLRVYIVFQPYLLGGKFPSLQEHELVNQIVDSLHSAVAHQRNVAVQIALVMLMPPISRPVPQGIDFSSLSGACILTPTRVHGLSLNEGEYESLYLVLTIILHALVTSEAGQLIIKYLEAMKAQKQPPLLTIGAASIYTALKHMYDYRLARTFNLLVEPFLGQPPEEEIVKADTTGAAWIKKCSPRWRMYIANALRKAHWKVEDDNIFDAELGDSNPLVEERHFYDVDLSEGLSEYIRKTYLGDVRVNEPPQSQLGDHFHRFDQELERTCKDVAQEQIESIAQISHDYIVNELRHLRNRYREMESLDRVLKARSESRHAGLLWGRYLLSGIVRDLPLGGVRDQKDQIIVPVSVAPHEVIRYRGGWHRKAAALGRDLLLKYLKCIREELITGSLGHVLLRIFPLWPIAALLTIALFPDVDPVWVWTGSFGVIVGGLALLYSQFKHKPLEVKMWLCGEYEKTVRSALLGIASNHVGQGRDSVHKKMVDIRDEYDKWVARLETSVEENSSQIELLQMAADAPGANKQDSLFGYRLFNLDACDSWVWTVIQTQIVSYQPPPVTTDREVETPAGDQKSSYTLYDAFLSILMNILLGNLTEDRGQLLLKRAVKDALDSVDATGYSERLATINLCDRDEDMATGYRWKWLYEHSIPMGPGDLSKMLTVVCLAHEKDLYGQGGIGEPEWNPEWYVARSRQPHRISMLQLIPYIPD